MLFLWIEQIPRIAENSSIKREKSIFSVGAQISSEIQYPYRTDTDSAIP